MPSHASGQPLPDWVTWTCCEETHDDGTPCTGAAQGDYGRCLAHLNPDDPDELEQAIKRAKTEGLDARGTSISPSLLSYILSFLDKTDQGLPVVPNARFERATFTCGGDSGFAGAAEFSRATFTGIARFDRATFTGIARFDRATFTGLAWFGDATFSRNAWFEGATFTGNAWFGGANFITRPHTWGSGEGFGGANFSRLAWFGGATFTGDARFDRANFGGDARFDRANFGGNAWFRGATFTGETGFGGATFTGETGFGGATFTGETWFDRVTFDGNARFDGANFGQHVRFGEVKFGGDVVFGGGAFDQRVPFRGMTFSGVPGFGGISLLVSSQELSFRSRRAAKTLWRAPSGDRVGEVDLSEVSFTGLAVLAATQGDAGSRRPKLVSLEQTDTTGLTVAGLDLSDCRFLGATNLDQLRIDGKLVLDGPPGWWRARRRVLREETVLRGWPDRPEGDPPRPLHVRELEPGDLLDAPAAISRSERASRLQTVYRALRKGREDDKDEPGAADFYYGEMEMRRLAASGWERALLTLYWLVSGYALRATRSLVAFTVVVTVFAVLLYLWGFQPASAPDLGGALVYSVESATVFFRGPGPEQLTEWGRVLQVCLRLLGPALLALTVLAVRGRVKR